LNPQTVPIPELLHDLLVAHGPSGHEGPAARVWRDAASAFAEVHSDTLGTSFARVRAAGGDGAPTLAIVGHIDEIGIAITNIEESGLLSISALGGFQPDVLIGQRVTIAARDGDVPGVIGRRFIASEKRRDEGKVELSDLHVDIGAKDGDEARTLVRVGDSAVWHGEPLELPNGRVVSKSMDNRLGAYVALEAARRVAEAGGVDVDVVGVAAVQEELGYYGSRTAAFSLDPDFGIAIDVTHATDVPGGDPKTAGKIELGSGAAIGRGPILNTGVSELLASAAEEEGIAHTFEVATNRTYTDADAVQVSRSGVPTGLVSIPLRYMHSPGELASLDDLEAVVALVVAFAKRLSRETSFLR
jgi:endoglucanase